MNVDVDKGHGKREIERKTQLGKKKGTRKRMRT